MNWTCLSCGHSNAGFCYSCKQCNVKTHIVGSKSPSELIRQGKYECGPAALAVLLGHSLFNIKRVLGSYGWRNDYSGVGEDQLRMAAREFGRDLIYCNLDMVDVLRKDVGKLPDAVITVPSLNYPKKYHGVAYYNSEVVDPNYGDNSRKYWCADACIAQMPISGASIITKEPINDEMYEEIAALKESKHIYTAVDMVLRIAG